MPPRPRYLTPLAPVVRCLCCARAAAAIARSRWHRQIGRRLSEDNQVFSPADFRSRAHVPIPEACSDCRTSRKARCIWPGQSELFLPGLTNFSESNRPASEFARRSQSFCYPPRRHRGVCAQFHDQHRRRRSLAGQKNRLSRSRLHRNAARTFRANVLLRSPALLRQESSVPAEIARTLPRLCLVRAPSVPSRKPPRLPCFSAQRKARIPSEKIRIRALRAAHEVLPPALA